MVRAARDGSWIVELNADTLPRVLVNRSYYTLVSKTAGADKDKGYSAGLPAERQLAGQEPRPTRAHDPEGGRRNRAPAGWLSDPRRQHMRPLNLKTVAEKIGMHEIDRLARDVEQVHGDAARHLRAEILLHVGHQRVRKRRRPAFVGSRAPPHQRQLIDAERPSDILSDDKLVEKLQVGRHRHRAAHGRQISRGHAHLVVRPAPARKADGREVSAICIRHFLRHIGAHILARGARLFGELSAW